MTITAFVHSIWRALQTGRITISLGLVTFPFAACLVPPPHATWTASDQIAPEATR